MADLDGEKVQWLCIRDMSSGEMHTALVGLMHHVCIDCRQVAACPGDAWYTSVIYVQVAMFRMMARLTPSDSAQLHITGLCIIDASISNERQAWMVGKYSGYVSGI